MRDSVKRFMLTATLCLLAVISAFYVDGLITKYEKEQYPLGKAPGLRETVASYSESYGIPEEVIYTVMKMRSGIDQRYDKNGRIGYMGLSYDEISELEAMLDREITSEMIRNPSNNLMFGIEYLNGLYKVLEDWNTVYAALLMGRSRALELSSDKKLTDITGSLIALPEGDEMAEEFKAYLKTEEKYKELYFNKATESERETVGEPSESN